MNREIKFRVWNVDGKVMVTDGLSFDYDHDEGPNNVYDGPGGSIFPFELMQFTGLKDKNGVEIYEGDIVRWVDSRRLERGDKDYSVVSTVAWSPTSAWWVVVDVSGGFVEGLSRVDMPEVVGTIYENPELLEKSK